MAGADLGLLEAVAFSVSAREKLPLPVLERLGQQVEERERLLIR
jgi:hypothetical protein